MSHACTGNADRLAQIALAHNLYHPRGGLSTQLKDAVRNPNNYIVAMQYDDDKPVGVGVCHKYSGLVAVWVEPDYRAKGYGGKLLNLALNTGNVSRYRSYAMLGMDEHKSLEFWKKHQIYVEPDLISISMGLLEQITAQGMAASLQQIKEEHARRRVERMREMNLECHAIVDEYLTTNDITVDGYQTKAVILT